MKTQSTAFFTEITRAYLMRLSGEVEETLAHGISHSEVNNNNHKILSAADVWNIQRNKKSRVQRRFSL
jgi:hypothetical protein